jgi:hypothetical protein
MATDTTTTRFPASWLRYRTHERSYAAERKRILRRDGEMAKTASREQIPAPRGRRGSCRDIQEAS